MTVSLDLPSELEGKLAREASERGVTLTEHLLHILATRRPANASIHSGQELVEYWRREGLLGTRFTEGDSAAHARTLRTQAESRERS